jgi:hypothetical protein
MSNPLKIEKSPKAFVPLAEKHNNLVKVVKGMTGRRGVKIVASDNNIEIGLIGTPVFVVGSLGYLRAVGLDFDPAYAAGLSTTYPTILKTLTGTSEVTMNATGVTVSDGTYSAVIDVATLTSKAKNMTLREIDVCDGGAAKKMLVLASAPY